MDIFIDTKMIHLRNRPRNRRVLFLVILVAGSFAGAFAYAKVGAAFALLLSAIGKTIVCTMVFFNRGEEAEEIEKTELVETGVC